MLKNEEIKKIMKRDLVDYLVKEKIITRMDTIIEDIFLTAYELIDNITYHMAATVNNIEYLVEKIIINENAQHTDPALKNTLNIYRLNEDEESIEFELMTTKKEEVKK